MYTKIEPFGHHIHANSIGEAWIDWVQAIMEHGEEALDEKRKRLCFQNVRIRIDEYELPDPIIERYGNKEKIDGIIYLFLKGKEMYDFDIIPSFSPGAKSYYARLKEGRLDEYVIKRLSEIPESKKAVMSFIHWDDYKAVLDTPYDDYLPCITTVQIRLLEKQGRFNMTTNWTARSLDGLQKANGNVLAIAMLAKKIQKELSKNLLKKYGKKVEAGPIDGFVTDIHIYEQNYDEARKLFQNYRNRNS